MGLNTISVYVFWNLHEPKPGVYDFTGNLDVAESVRIAQQEGLNVLLRPGPNACAEWELGGYPAWLIEDPGMVLRSNAPQYMEPVKRWMARLGEELAPLQSGRGALSSASNWKMNIVPSAAIRFISLTCGTFFYSRTSPAR
jgi:beta-galactosidase